MSNRHPYALRDKQGRFTAYALACGYVEFVGDFVEITRDPLLGFYRIVRSDLHRLGEKTEVRHLLNEARAVANKWERAK